MPTDHSDPISDHVAFQADLDSWTSADQAAREEYADYVLSFEASDHGMKSKPMSPAQFFADRAVRIAAKPWDDFVMEARLARLAEPTDLRERLGIEKPTRPTKKTS